jgi:long-chain acyl-CoA synthetase
MKLISPGTAPAEAAELRAEIEGVTVPSLFAAAVAARGAETALRLAAAEGGTEIGWDEYADRVARAAAGIAALGFGPGDRAVLMLRNVPDFHVADLALKHLGICPVSIYNSSAAEQIAFIAGHCGARLAIVEPAFLPRFLEARASLPDLDQIVVVGGSGGEAGADWASLLESDPTVIYTSGSTGPPKGVMLTHANIAWQTAAMARRIEEPMAGWRQISYLPMAHIGERMMGHYLAIRGGTDVTCCPDPGAAGGMLTEVRPQIFLGMPRMWEKLHAELLAHAARNPEDCERERLLGVVGLDRGRIMLTSGGVLATEIHAFFRELGLPLSDIYGMSESTGPVCWSPHDPLPGCVGRSMPGCELRLEDDNEIAFRTGATFSGYLEDPERTAEIDAGGGWFRSGDIGALDPSGQLQIVDRKKEIMITAGGKNISPANLEKALKAQPLIGQAVAIGEARRFVSALLVLDPTAAGEWARGHGLEGVPPAALVADERLRQLVAAQVEAANEAFSQVEKVKRFTLLPTEWVPDSDELTPTAKLKRGAVAAKYADEIEAMYAESRTKEPA